MNTEKILEELLSSLKTIDSNDIPNIDLYMDQVTTFMDGHLACFKRTDDEKILTKTMINNYAKSSLLPSPEKKKYSKDHMITLILIYYLKNVLSINDIEKVMAPISQNYFGNKADLKVVDIYDYLTSQADALVDSAKDDIIRKYNIVASAELLDKTSTLEDSDKRREELETFATILALTYDITIKKQLIEKLIDSMEPLEDKREIEKEKEKENKKDKEKTNEKERDK